MFLHWLSITSTKDGFHVILLWAFFRFGKHLRLPWMFNFGICLFIMRCWTRSCSICVNLNTPTLTNMSFVFHSSCHNFMLPIILGMLCQNVVNMLLKISKCVVE
jgi:hypothetical protein